MRAKTNGIKKHSGRHNDIIHFTTVLVNEGFDTPEKVAYEIGEREWMSPESKTGSDYKSILIEVKRTWNKALQLYAVNLFDISLPGKHLLSQWEE